VPAALKLKEEYGDDLQVIFAESQNSGYEKSIADALKYGWLTHDVIWSSDYLFSTGSKGLPSFALLDAEGRVVLKGSSSDLKGKMEDEIERMVQELKAGPADMPKAVAKIYSELNKGGHAKALIAAEKLKAKPGSKDTEMVLSATESAIANIHANLDSQLARADWLLQNGYPTQAKELVSNLLKGVKDNADMTAKVEASLAKFEGEEIAAQLAADKDLSKLQNKLFADKNGEKVSDKLLKLAEENASNPIGKRARILAGVASGKAVEVRGK
jgi:hypothetical protein